MCSAFLRKRFAEICQNLSETTQSQSFHPVTFRIYNKELSQLFTEHLDQQRSLKVICMLVVHVLHMILSIWSFDYVLTRNCWLKIIAECTLLFFLIAYLYESKLGSYYDIVVALLTAIKSMSIVWLRVSSDIIENVEDKGQQKATPVYLLVYLVTMYMMSLSVTRFFLLGTVLLTLVFWLSILMMVLKMTSLILPTQLVASAILVQLVFLCLRYNSYRLEAILFIKSIRVQSEVEPSQDEKVISILPENIIVIGSPEPGLILQDLDENLENCEDHNSIYSDEIKSEHGSFENYILGL